MPRPSADLLPPIEVSFGQIVYRKAFTSKPIRAVVTEVDHHSNSIQMSKILSEERGQERITVSGTASRDNIVSVTPEIWDHTVVAAAFLRYLGLMNTEDSQWHYDTFRAESLKPPIILR